jgi:hypothetical protein
MNNNPLHLTWSGRKRLDKERKNVKVLSHHLPDWPEKDEETGIVYYQM